VAKRAKIASGWLGSLIASSAPATVAGRVFLEVSAVFFKKVKSYAA
jgi:hypothetical protein